MAQYIKESERDWDVELAAYLKKNKTLAQLMLKNAEKFGEREALASKVNGKWESMTWKKLGEDVKAVARALLEMDILQPGDMASIFSQNRTEWAVADLGILSVRGVSVPIYATNSEDETEYIINDAEVSIVFTGDQGQYDHAKKILGRNKYLKKIVAFDRETKIEGDESIYFDDLLKIGYESSKEEELQERLNGVDPEDTLTLIYTSGTTGAPKGAIHTHRSFLNGIFPTGQRYVNDVGEDTVSLAILPLSHVFERMWSYGCMSLGVKIAYCPDPKQFIEVMAELKPQCMTSVPRIWEKVFGTIHDGLKTASPLKKNLFNWALGVGLKVYRNKLEYEKSGLMLKVKHRIADALILKKVRAKLGTERCLIYHVGGAAFATEINEFFQAFGINLIQGYGLTEFFPVGVGYGDYGLPGGCGPKIPMCEMRIADDGEIQLKGGMCMKGYHKKDDATKDCFTDDGWFKTQDVGELIERNNDGEPHVYVKITDRIKDLIITAGGKNISPQQIEMLLGDELLVEQFVAIGEGRKFISALVVPNFDILEQYCKNEKIEFSSHEELLQKPEIIKLYEERIAERTSSLGRVEQIKKFSFIMNELTQEGGELTPTMKLKRKVITEKYSDLIEEMYL